MKNQLKGAIKRIYYQNEFNFTIDFIKKSNCDIMYENYSENIYEEVI